MYLLTSKYVMRINMATIMPYANNIRSPDADKIITMDADQIKPHISESSPPSIPWVTSSRNTKQLLFC